MWQRMASGLAVALLGAGLITVAQAAKPGSNIQIVSPWVREVPPVSHNSAAFLTVRNTGKTADVLESVETPAADAAEMHEMSMAGGVMRMQKLETVLVPAGATVEFTPDDRHIMLFGLKAPLKAGMSVPLILHFHKAGAVRVVAPVKADS